MNYVEKYDKVRDEKDWTYLENKLDGVGEDFKKWCTQIENAIRTSGKKIVFVAGSSCSGKGTNTKMLVEYLNRVGINAVHIEADLYYKGVGRIAVEKVIEKMPKFQKYQDKKFQITDAILSVNKLAELKDKFTVENTLKIARNLGAILDKEDVKDFVLALKYETDNINFDEPSTNKFYDLSVDLHALAGGETRKLSKYSFDCSECVDFGNQIIDGKTVDVFLVEGLYSLRPEHLQYYSKDEYISTFIDCNPLTIVSRRYFRDIMQSGRTTIEPKQTIPMVLRDVIPSYYKYVLPTRENAQFILKNELTQNELDKKHKHTYSRFKINEWQYNEICSAVPNSREQGLVTDFYFKSDGDENNMSFRLRGIDGVPTVLSIIYNNETKYIVDKFGDKEESITRDDYNLEYLMGDANLSLQEFCEKILACGFKTEALVTKYREVFKTIGYFGPFNMVVDEMKDGSKIFEVGTGGFEKDIIIKLLKISQNQKITESEEVSNFGLEVRREEKEKNYIQYDEKV